MLKPKRLSASIAIISAISINHAYAATYEFDDFTVNWDSVFTAGVQYRIEDRIDYISQGSSGKNGELDNLATIIDNAFILNSNDGNNNFDKGFTSQRTSILSEADFNFGEWGFFVRGKYWHDFRYGSGSDMTKLAWESNNTNPKFGLNGGNNATFGELNPAAKAYSESGSSLLDFFWYGKFNITEDRELTIRFGKQVISWGEALLSGGGLATAINHVDAHIRNQPGLEIKELFLPSEAILFQTSINDKLGIEAYYQWRWHPAFIDPSGSYFSEFDSLGPGGSTFMFVTGLEDKILGKDLHGLEYSGDDPSTAALEVKGQPIPVADYNSDQKELAKLLQFLPTNCKPTDGQEAKCRLLAPYKLRTDRAADSGQYGLAFNFFLNDGAEASLYYVNYHEKIPNFILPVDALIKFAPIIDLLVAVVDPVTYKQNFTDKGRHFVGMEDLGKDLSLRQLNVLLGFMATLPPRDGTLGSLTADLVRNPHKFFSQESALNPVFEATSSPLAQAAITAISTSGMNFFLKPYGFNSDTKVRSINYRVQYAENVNMIGATYSTVLGDANVATEMTYRANTPLMSADVPRTPYRGGLLNWHINSLMVFEPKELFGINLWDFSSMLMEVLFWEAPGKLPYDASDAQNKRRLAVQNTPTGMGYSIFWSLEYQNVFTGWDVMVPIYMNYGIDGSQFNAGYRDGQVTTATGLTFKHVSGIEAGIGITTFWGDTDDVFQMLTQDRDNMTATFKYAF